MKSLGVTRILEKVVELCRFLFPRYQAEGKAYLTVALGCTGGKHRSVSIAHELGKRLQNLKFSPELRFELDPSIEYSVHISELLKEVLPHGESPGTDEESTR